MLHLGGGGEGHHCEQDRRTRPTVWDMLRGALRGVRSPHPTLLSTVIDFLQSRGSRASFLPSCAFSSLIAVEYAVQAIPSCSAFGRTRSQNFEMPIRLANQHLMQVPTYRRYVPLKVQKHLLARHSIRFGAGHAMRGPVIRSDFKATSHQIPCIC